MGIDSICQSKKIMSEFQTIPAHCLTDILIHWVYQDDKFQGAFQFCSIDTRVLNGAVSPDCYYDGRLVENVNELSDLLYERTMYLDDFSAFGGTHVKFICDTCDAPDGVLFDGTLRELCDMQKDSLLNSITNVGVCRHILQSVQFCCQLVGISNKKRQ